MCSLMRKPAVLLSILALLPLASASAELKKVPLILMDHGSFEFPDPLIPRANLTGEGTSTHLGKIASTGEFESLGPGPPERFKGKIEGTATVAPSEPDSITYRLSAEFRPDASGIFYGVGTYVITGGTGKFKQDNGNGTFHVYTAVGVDGLEVRAYEPVTGNFIKQPLDAFQPNRNYLRLAQFNPPQPAPIGAP
jgi:hypothetical protein